MTSRCSVVIALAVLASACSSESAEDRALREARAQAAGTYRRTAGYADYLARFPAGAAAAEARHELDRLVGEAVAAYEAEARKEGGAPEAIAAMAAMLRAAGKDGVLRFEVAFERTIAPPYDSEYIKSGEATIREEVFRSFPGDFEARAPADGAGAAPGVVIAYELALEPARVFEVDGKPLVGARIAYTASVRTAEGAPPTKVLGGEVRLPETMPLRTFHRPTEGPRDVNANGARNAIRAHLSQAMQRALSRGLGRGDRRGGWPSVIETEPAPGK